jgi:hypothetical protein
MTFSGGGMQGGTFGAAVDAKDNAWLTSYGGKTITVFDKNGKPLTPPEGLNFGGKLGLMQGVIVTPSGDVWVLGLEKSQLVHFPQGDLAKGRIVCEGDGAEPCKSFKLPFHLGIDQQDRIWVTNGGSDHVVRFLRPAVAAALRVAAGADEGTKASHAARMRMLLQAPVNGWLGFFMGVELRTWVVDLHVCSS